MNFHRDRLLVAHCIASLRSDHGGTSRSVPALCESLAELNAEIHIVTAKPANPAIKCTQLNPKVYAHWGQENRWVRQWTVASAFGQFLNEIRNDALFPMIVHDHGVWLRSNHAAAAFATQHRIPRVVSPRGMLAPWSMNHARWKKQLMWKLFQHRDLLNATMFHATSEQEADEVRGLGFTQPIVVVPNGVTFPDTMPARDPSDTTRRLLFLSRIHPKKGLVNLVQAWRKAAPSKDWKLVIAGPDEGGHLAEVQNAVRENGVSDSVEFMDEVAERDKWKFLVTGEAFVLPSFSENFGNVVAEAMAAGLPVIATKGTPWSILKETGLGWWVEPNPVALTEALVDLTSRPREANRAQGERCVRFVRERFTWNGVARAMLDAYQGLIGG